MFITFNTVMSLAYGPPALLGLVKSRAPSWTGLLTFTVGLVPGCYGSFVASPVWGLVRTVGVVVSVSFTLFLFTMLVPEENTPERRARRAGTSQHGCERRSTSAPNSPRPRTQRRPCSAS